MEKTDENTTLQEIKDLLVKFRDERDWKKFHDAKNIAEAIVIESGELLELMLWKDKESVEELIENDASFKESVREELADVINYCISFANTCGIDIYQSVSEKIEKNRKKYPKELVKGSAAKYTHYE